jgi:hypothetical protein
VILLDAVVQVLALPSTSWFKTAARPILKAFYGVTGNDRFPVGLAAVDNDALRPAMPGESLSEKAFGDRKVTVLAESELDRVTAAVDGAIEIHPLATNLDIGLVGMPFAGDGTLAPMEALQQQGREMHDPAVNR